MKTTYNIRITSRTIYLFSLLISLIVGIIGPTYLLSISGYKFGTAFYCLVGLIVVFTLIRLLKPISKKKAIITIDQKLLIINLFPSVFKKNERTVEIPWSELDSFLIEPTQHLTKVRFKLKNGKKVFFFLDTDDSMQTDYMSFEMALYKNIISINNEHQSKGIARQKTIYERLLGLILAVLCSISLAIIPVVYIIRQVAPPLGSLLLAYSAGIYFIWMVYKSRKK